MVNKEMPGAVAYMPPQVRIGKSQQSFSLTLDIWSFGVVIIEMIIKNLPQSLEHKMDVESLISNLKNEKDKAEAQSLYKKRNWEWITRSAFIPKLLFGFAIWDG